MVKSSNGIIQGNGNNHSTTTRDIARRLSGCIDIASSNISGFGVIFCTRSFFLGDASLINRGRVHVKCTCPSTKSRTNYEVLLNKITCVMFKRRQTGNKILYPNKFVDYWIYHKMLHRSFFSGITYCTLLCANTVNLLYNY